MQRMIRSSKYLFLSGQKYAIITTRRIAMKHAKRILSFLFALLLTLALFGCEHVLTPEPEAPPSVQLSVPPTLPQSRRSRSIPMCRIRRSRPRSRPKRLPPFRPKRPAPSRRTGNTGLRMKSRSTFICSVIFRATTSARAKRKSSAGRADRSSRTRRAARSAEGILETTKDFCR